MHTNMFSKFKITIISFLAAVSFIFLVGCAASTPTTIGDNLYRTSCSGIVNDWSYCYDAAKAQCTSGYTERDRRQINHPGQYNTACLCMIYPVDRELVFSCR